MATNYTVSENGKIIKTTEISAEIWREYKVDHRGVAIIKAGRLWFVSNFWEHSGGSRTYQHLNAANSESAADSMFENLVDICRGARASEMQ
jgi:hypothetical protein